MNKEMLVEQVLEYVKDDNAKYAIMIDGPWGCGKTYLYENCLKREIASIETGKNNKDRRYNVYISLYGIDSLETLSKTLLVKYLLRKKNSKGEKKAEGALTVLGGAVNTAGNLVSVTVPGFSFSFKEIKNDIGKTGRKLFNPKNAIICFDDLERSTISIPVLMGYINNLIEHCGCKVIILADEKNIGKIYANTGIESKYGVVLAGGRKLDISEAITGQKKNDDSEPGVNSISLEELKASSEFIFSENYIYRDIKEKVVGKTLLYLPNMETVFTDVFSDYKFTGLYGNAESTSKYLKEKRDVIIEAFKYCKCNNVRIVYSWLALLPKLLSYVEKSGVEIKYFERLKEEVIKYSICYICHKSMNMPHKVEWEESFDFANTIGTIQYVNFSLTYAFGFVDELIDCGMANNKSVSEGISAYVKKEHKKEIENPVSVGVMYQELEQSGWYMEDNELAEKVRQLLEEIEAGKYTFTDYRKIFWLLFNYIEEKVIDYTYENISKTMIDSLAKNKLGNMYYRDPLEFDSKQDEEKFEELYEPIEVQIYHIIEENTKESTKANSLYRNLDNFGRYVREGRQEGFFIIRQGFFKYLSLSELKKLINRFNREEVYRFANLIDSVYDFVNLKEYLADDIVSLESFSDWLKESNASAFNGKTGEAARQYLREEIEKIIARLN